MLSGQNTSISAKVRKPSFAQDRERYRRNKKTNRQNSTGLAKAIIKQYQEMAQKDDTPIWLEASNRQSREVYLNLGFQDVEMLTFGKGKVSPEGMRQPGGPGVPVWAMIWWPKRHEEI